MAFPVQPGAKNIVVELVWKDSVQDIDAVLGSFNDCFVTKPSPVDSTLCSAQSLQYDGSGGTWWNQAGHAGTPDSPSVIRADAKHIAPWMCGQPDLNCTWYAQAWNKDIVTGLDFEIYATVFYAKDAPAGYTAVPTI